MKFNWKMIARWLLLTVFVGISAVLLKIVTQAVLDIAGNVWGIVVSVAVTVGLFMLVMALRPGKEEFNIEFVTDLVIIGAIFTIFGAFGLNAFSTAFNLSTPLGWLTAGVVFFSGDMITQKIMKKV